MWEIGYLIVCEDVGKTSNGELMMKPIGVMSPINIPGNYSFYIAFSLFNKDINKSKEDGVLRFIVKDPNNGVVEDSGDLNFNPIPLNESSDEHELATGEADIRLNNVELNIEGVYEVELIIDGNSKRVKFPVKVKNKSNQQGATDGRKV
ncbi:hypothetical protein [Shouchella patagoniensis]|uniref:hypothetical protein n=1 Tax=Shouchella patagoniensis TaxID=228576 RepID=UPI000994FF7F|nr:hypothetical protein [Shouchella patagoniensis]